jgi:hypothetical protein
MKTKNKKDGKIYSIRNGYRVIEPRRNGNYRFFVCDHVCLGAPIWMIFDRGIPSWEIGQLLGGN